MATGSRSRKYSHKRQGQTGQGCRDDDDKRQHSAIDPVFYYLRAVTYTIGMDQAGGQKCQAQQMQQPCRSALKLGKSHDQDGEGNIFSKIAMHPDALSHLAVARITKIDFFKAAVADDTHGQIDKKQGSNGGINGRNGDHVNFSYGWIRPVTIFIIVTKASEKAKLALP